MYSIGKYNIIEDKVTIGNDAVIKNFTHLHEEVHIGEGTKIGNYCEIEKGVRIGKNCLIQGRVRIGPNVVIEDNVIIKYGAIITDYVTIKEGAFIGPNVITLGSDLDRDDKSGTIIGPNCFIGAGTKIAPSIKICNDVVIGANSFVNRNISNPDTYVGSPVRPLSYL